MFGGWPVRRNPELCARMTAFIGDFCRRQNHGRMLVEDKLAEREGFETGVQCSQSAGLQRVSPPTGDRVDGWRRACPDDLRPPAWPPASSLRPASLYKNVSSWRESRIAPFGSGPGSDAATRGEERREICICNANEAPEPVHGQGARLDEAAHCSWRHVQKLRGLIDGAEPGERSTADTGASGIRLGHWAPRRVGSPGGHFSAPPASAAAAAASRSRCHSRRAR
jgi:hypothetical protein